jgi:D-alanyl-D-alanine carboxypeptidase/D-alanyl-D-alanine-endopeptidase (penicillin-binding protein 4)
MTGFSPANAAFSPALSPLVIIDEEFFLQALTVNCKLAVMDFFLPTFTLDCRLSTVDRSFGRLRVRIPKRLARLCAIFVVTLSCAALSPPFLSAANRPTKQHGAPALNKRLDEILRSSAASRGFWGIEVAELPNGRILFSRDAQHLFHPASNMKLFTTAAGLEKLGPDFVFRTTVESDSAPDAQGRAQNLFLVGRGDPSFCDDVTPPLQDSAVAKTNPCPTLQKLAEQLRARGVLEVSGPLVADDSYFLWEPYIHGWAAEDLLWGYGATVSALALNSNALHLRIKPGFKAGDRAQVWLDPLADYYQLNNSLETSGAGTEEHLWVERELDSMRLDVWGQIPLDAGETTERVAIAHPPQLVGELFLQALGDAGIVVKGGVQVSHVTRLEAAKAGQTSPQLSSRVVLAEHDSQPLRAIVKATNKESRNFYAEMLLRTLACEVKHRGGLEDSLEVLSDYARQIGAEQGETVFADGSGLSRDDLVTPDTLVKLLIHMASGPAFEVFLNTLPVAGVDGTLAGRFKGTRAKGRIHAKTGTLEQVNALSGYMDLPSGKRLVFSIIGNSHSLKEQQGAATIDQIALAVYDWFSRRKR